MKAPLKITTEQMPYSYDVGGMFMNYYFHFYDEIPGLGKVFHAGMCMDQICFDGNLYADFVGNQMDVDKGTYEIDMATYSFILHLENAAI